MPSRMLGLAEVTEIDWRTAGLTVSDVEPVTPQSVALIDERAGRNGQADTG